ncbi:DNA polymerase III subunit delta' [Calothrix sp. 336/3]|uniref:DNA polymerase III subunit delta' n=1 Tax=Calothrix sp. 336/3 TaxID=1337936 RepID=UPI0004E2E334|nr:DNA polymerase III subunit delta' [Calothrix sp. 336/3]AKG20006.1 DNA polymerase III subunit delta' [Calothrix sp. 336/3]
MTDLNYFTPLIGQSSAVELLIQAVRQNRIPPAYLFVGAEGIGRSLAARCWIDLLFASAKNRSQQANHPDLLWVEPTYQHQGQRLTAQEAAEKGVKRKASPIIRLEQIREITDFLSRPPLEATRHIVVLENAEAMAEAPANALLKTLEEPGRATLILLAPAIDAILPTLVSRCQKIPFQRLNSSDMAEVLGKIGHTEILQHPEILQMAAGSPGMAIAYFQQLANIPSEILQAVKNMPRNQREALELAKQIDKNLDYETQLWLVDYLQQSYWQNQHQPQIIAQLEKARKYLQVYAQPRLVWECTLLSIYQNR